MLWLISKTGSGLLQAQSISQSVISSNGMFVETTEASLAWTIGEVTIETLASSNFYMTQGFHQPSIVVVEKPWTFFIPEGFSPNGDGINDYFVIRGIDHFTKNNISIYNRWGDLVFQTKSYNNTWDGTSNNGISIGGNQLPIGTYFYILDLADGSPIHKGTLYLNR